MDDNASIRSSEIEQVCRNLFRKLDVDYISVYCSQSRTFYHDLKVEIACKDAISSCKDAISPLKWMTRKLMLACYYLVN
jgi:hypothetical protein